MLEWVDEETGLIPLQYRERPSLLSATAGEIRVTTFYRGFPVEGESL
jgi:hypothetical protein